MTSIYWLIALLLFLIIEAFTLGLTTIWFAGGALIAFFCSLCGVPLAVQFVLFIIISFVLLFCTRPLLAKRLNISREKTNVNRMIGAEGIVTDEIDNFKQKGTIVIDGMEWTARSQDESIIPKDSKVVVQEIKGVKAIVTVKEEKGSN